MSSITVYLALLTILPALIIPYGLYKLVDYLNSLEELYLPILPGRKVVLEYTYQEVTWTVTGRVLISLPYRMLLLNRRWHVLPLDTARIRSLAIIPVIGRGYPVHRGPGMDSMLALLLPRAPETAHLHNRTRILEMEAFHGSINEPGTSFIAQ
ncbi:hypothetical protein FRC06_006787 [Ceratobasidium sp. 370]|nr:hypothetical protein FRC06_006787 [Ceratobasidium sp. 370]